VSVIDGPLVFVDVETTGLSYSRSRIIEVAAVRVENDKVIDSFSSLIDPESELPMYITELTGISANDLKAAPTFFEVSDRLYEIMRGATFVAHNARFDYGFLKTEFKRIGKKFSPQLLCTVRLSKTLYPSLPSHKLQNLIDLLNLEVARRHRALDDTQVMLQFIQHAKVTFPASVVEAAVRQQIKSPSLPKQLPLSLVQGLSEETGVYIFNDKDGSPLYIGKSVNIKKRVYSHFSSDHDSESEFKIAQQIADIQTITTGSELGALLLESKLIKEMQPLHNRQLRRKQKLTLARQFMGDDGYLRISTEDIDRIMPDDIGNILGVYTSKGKARQFIEELAKSFDLCPKLLGMEKSKGSCFSYQLKRCRGACVNQETKEIYNARLAVAFERSRLQQWPYASPVVISERTDSNDKEAIIVDQWCVVADVTEEQDCQPRVNFHDRLFDLDTYKILRSFISQKAHRLDIKPISYTSLDSLRLAEVL
jgi:DNA polymerase-3 subunit epsilon